MVGSSIVYVMANNRTYLNPYLGPYGYGYSSNDSDILTSELASAMPAQANNLVAIVAMEPGSGGRVVRMGVDATSFARAEATLALAQLLVLAGGVYVTNMAT